MGNAGTLPSKKERLTNHERGKEKNLPESDYKKLYSVKQMMGLFACTRKTIWNRVECGQLPQPFKHGGMNYWFRETVDELLERGKRELAGR